MLSMRTFRVCAPGFAALMMPIVAVLLAAAVQAGVVVHYEFENGLLDTGADGIIADAKFRAFGEIYGEGIDE